MNPLSYLLRQLDWSEVSVKNKLLAVFSFCFIISSITSIFINLYVGLPPQINIVVLFVLGIHSIAFYSAISNLISDKGRFIYLSILVTLLPLAWVFNGGMLGAIPMYYFIYFAASILSLTRQYRNYFISYIIFITLVPLFIEYCYPEIIIPYESVEAQFYDLKMSYIQVIITTILLTTTYTSINDDIQLQLVKYQGRIEDSYIKLSMAKEDADIAAAAKSNFITNISHEIRTPLTGIIGLTDLLATSSPLSNEQKLLLHSLNSSSKTLLELVNDLLDLSKMEANKLQLNKEYFDLRKVVEEIEDLITLQLREKNIKLTIDVSDKIENLVYLDRNKYKQVLINLLSNAIKFTKQGRVTCTIDYNNTKSELVTKVEDSGIGIDEKDYDKIFIPFSQLNRIDDSSLNGVGMGLTISKNMVEIMKGTISFTSKVDSGSCFKFNIPITSNKKKLKSLISNSITNIDTIQNNGLHVLIAEDNKVNQMVLAKMIIKLNHTYELAENGQEAIDLCKENTYDAILMDIQMPVINGIEATKTILEYYKNIGKQAPKVIICSADTHFLNEESLLRKIIADYLIKPINLEQIDKVLNKISPNQDLDQYN